MQQSIAYKCYNYLILFIVIFGRVNSAVKNSRFFINGAFYPPPVLLLFKWSRANSGPLFIRIIS